MEDLPIVPIAIRACSASGVNGRCSSSIPPVTATDDTLVTAATAPMIDVAVDFVDDAVGIEKDCKLVDLPSASTPFLGADDEIIWSRSIVLVAVVDIVDEDVVDFWFH
jgi:hypothetical protein